MKLSDFIAKEVFCQSEQTELSQILEAIWELNAVGEKQLNSLSPDDLAGAKLYEHRLYSDKAISRLTGDPAKEAQDFVLEFREQIEIALPLIKGEAEEVRYKTGYMWRWTYPDGKTCIKTNYVTPKWVDFMVPTIS